MTFLVVPIGIGTYGNVQKNMQQFMYNWMRAMMLILLAWYFCFRLRIVCSSLWSMSMVAILCSKSSEPGNLTSPGQGKVFFS